MCQTKTFVERKKSFHRKWFPGNGLQDLEENKAVRAFSVDPPRGLPDKITRAKSDGCGPLIPLLPTLLAPLKYQKHNVQEKQRNRGTVIQL